MFLIILSAFLFAIGYGFWKWYKKTEANENHYDDGEVLQVFAVIFWALSGILFFASWTATGVYYAEQVRDIEQVVRTQKTQIILAEKRDALQKQLDGYLDNKYFKHEKGIFNSINKNPKLIAAAFPGLTAFKTIISLTDTIKKLQDDYYAQRVTREKILARIRYRTKSPWVFWFFIPGYTTQQ